MLTIGKTCYGYRFSNKNEKGETEYYGLTIRARDIKIRKSQWPPRNCFYVSNNVFGRFIIKALRKILPHKSIVGRARVCDPAFHKEWEAYKQDKYYYDYEIMPGEIVRARKICEQILPKKWAKYLAVYINDK